MTENEQIFWNRVLELAKSQLKQATYEFFVLDARLIQIEQKYGDDLPGSYESNSFGIKI